MQLNIVTECNAGKHEKCTTKMLPKC